MSYRRSKSNAQQIRTLRRMKDEMRRAEDERIARLVEGCRAGAR